ncbi:MAG: lamin tail domain-containing protein [Anaerolineales bacterium]|nr:lamin tail domain-containing protein [Anaerolineales bacterium]
MQSKMSGFVLAFIIGAVSVFILVNSWGFVPETAVAGAGTPDVFTYLPLVVKPAPTPTPTVPPTPTMAPADVRLTLIVYNPAGDDVLGEFVRLQNFGGSAAVMTGWTLSDDDGRVFTFPGFSLAAGASVQVWTKAGANSATDLYWGDSLSIWTNTGDVAYLRNGGLLVDSCAYAGGGVQASC